MYTQIKMMIKWAGKEIWGCGGAPVAGEVAPSAWITTAIANRHHFSSTGCPTWTSTMPCCLEWMFWEILVSYTLLHTLLDTHKNCSEVCIINNILLFMSDLSLSLSLIYTCRAKDTWFLYLKVEDFRNVASFVPLKFKYIYIYIFIYYICMY